MKNAEEVDDHLGASYHPTEGGHQRELEAKARVAFPAALVVW
jgi:hypothetical protein